MTKFEPHKNVYYDMNKFEKNYWWYLGLRDLLRYYIMYFNPRKVLDAGCGTGTNLEEIKNIVKEVYGIDISEEAIKFTKAKKLRNTIQGNITRLPFNDENFDLIYSFDVFGNLNKQETYEVLQEFSRCLEKDGVILIQTASLKWLNSGHDTYWDIQKRYELDELVELIEKKNFMVIKKTYRHFFLFPIIVLVKIKNKNNLNISGDLKILPKFVNYTLYLIMKIENFILRFISFPIGSSVFIIAKKIS